MLHQHLAVFRILAQFLQAQVFADRDIFHLRRDDSLAGVVHLRDVGAGFRAARPAQMFEA